MFWGRVILVASALAFAKADAPARFDDDFGLLAAYPNTSFTEFDDMLAPGMSGQLIPRQRVCSVPGGPICSATTCCRPGLQCCPTGCCPVGDTCLPNMRCCPPIGVVCAGKCCETGAGCCNGSPTGCCRAGAVCCPSGCCPPGYKCCRGGCCPAADFCEVDQCLAISLQKKVIRFKYDEKKNGHILRNMCNGMRGKNTQTFTYSGRLSKSSKRQKRRDAGCKSGFCKRRGVAGLNSCDEWPPASTDEGGNATAQLQRAVNCVPATQNSYQGGVFSGLLSGLTQGDQFVISIDCDEVLGSIVPRADIEEGGVTGTNESYPQGLMFVNGSDANPQPYLIVPLGDLDSGEYTVTMNVTRGRALNATVVSNEGDELLVRTDPIATGESASLTFDLVADMFGVGVLLAVDDDRTNVTWNLTGTLHPPSEEEDSPPPSGSDSGGDSDGDGGTDEASHRMIVRASVFGLVLLALASVIV